MFSKTLRCKSKVIFQWENYDKVEGVWSYFAIRNLKFLFQGQELVSKAFTDTGFYLLSAWFMDFFVQSVYTFDIFKRFFIVNKVFSYDECIDAYRIIPDRGFHNVLH